MNDMIAASAVEHELTRHVETVLRAMFDRLESCVWPCVCIDDTFECGFNPNLRNPYSRYVNGVLEMTAAVLWFMSKAKGCGIGDIKEGFLHPRVYVFMIDRMDAEEDDELADDATHPPCLRTMAKEFVKEYVEA